MEQSAEQVGRPNAGALGRDATRRWRRKYSGVWQAHREVYGAQKVRKQLQPDRRANVLASDVLILDDLGYLARRF